MKNSTETHRLLVALVATFAVVGSATVGQAQQLLIADRVTDNVYRYGRNGNLIGTVLTDTTGLLDPSGLAISPDYTKLYVTSSGNNTVIQYDYDFATGTAGNPTTFADESDGLAFPNGIKISPDGNTIYVSNLNGAGVSRFTNGVPGTPLFEASTAAYSGLEFAPTGELLVGGFFNLMNGGGGVVKEDVGSFLGLSELVAPSLEISGAAGLLVSGNELYVSGVSAGNIRRFNVANGALDAGFGITGLESPQTLLADPAGTGFLVGILGPADGEGYIERYDFNGNSLGIFAGPGAGGFEEATAFISIIPEPASVVPLLMGAIALVLNRRRTSEPLKA